MPARLSSNFVGSAFLNLPGTLGGAEISLLDILASLREAEPDWPSTSFLVETVQMRSCGGCADNVLPFHWH
jgi:hypothetical protein